MFGGQPFGGAGFGEASTPLYVRISIRLSVAISLEYRIFAADSEFITDATDTPALQPYSDILDEPLAFTWSLRGDRFSGFIDAGGNTLINNADGQFDTLSQRYTTVGRPVEVRLGRKGDPQTAWLVVFKGLSQGEFIDDETFEISNQDNGYKLDVPLQPRTYLGTGGLEGGDDLKGKPLPLCFGWLGYNGVGGNFEAPLVIPNEFLYQIHDGPVQAITAVYDDGVPLAFDADYATVADLRAASIPSGQYGTCIAEGYFRINQDVTEGAVTCDAQGDVFDGQFNDTTAAIIIAAIRRATELEYPGEVSLPSFAAFESIQPAPVGIYISHTEPISVAEFIGRLISGVSGFCGFRRDGKLIIGRRDLEVGPPVKRYDKFKFDPKPEKERLPDSVWPPPSKWQVGYARNYTQQTDPAGLVTVERRAFLAEIYRYGLAEDATVRTNYPFGKEPQPIEAFFRDLADAEAEAERLLELYRAARGIYRFGIDHRAGAELNIGDEIWLQHDRGDLVQGRYCTVVGIVHSASTKSVQVTAIG